MMVLSSALTRLLCLASVASAFQPFRTSFSLPELRELTARNANQRSRRRDVDLSLMYRAHNISVPIDHFHNDSSYEPHSDGMFNLRYWFDATYYKKGGPIIVLQSGETSGEGRLPFLQKGIVAQLSQATGGLGVILEHRYYGTSFPVSDLSTENLRFLTIDQAVKDMVYFAQHVVFEGMEDLDLTAPKNAYIAYGGSYAGAFVAILRKLYPDVYWGAISSSGVTEAIYDYWEYYEAARLYAPRDCVTTTQKLTHAIDNILIGKNGTDYVARLKKVMGFENVTRNDDFAYAISFGIGGLQGTNWDPAINSTDFGVYCDTISSDTLLYPDNESRRPEVRDLLTAGGYGGELDVLTNRMLNYIGYLNDTVLETCQGRTQDSCFTSFNSTFYRQDDISQDWRSWPYQYCTQWGYLQTGSGVPPNILPLISRLIDLNFTSVVCREAFNITEPPDVTAINKYGGFGISYPRLAIIDGEHDPWRAATPHAIGQPDRKSTISEPFILIDGAVHHWDENGLFPNETTPELPPRPVADAQRAEAKFVQEWMKEWKRHCKNDGRCSP